MYEAYGAEGQEHGAKCIEQTADDQAQKSEDGGRITDDRNQKTDVRGHGTGGFVICCTFATNDIKIKGKPISGLALALWMKI
jgi:hypothetical protein